MNDKTATECLRELLDERGVKWCPSAWDRSTETYWKTADGNGCLATQGETKLRLSFADYLTPEQAIEATLGRGTCRLESMHGYTDPYVTTRYVVELSCHTLDDWPESEPPAYCPWCGAKVVDDD